MINLPGFHSAFCTASDEKLDESLGPRLTPEIPDESFVGENFLKFHGFLAIRKNFNRENSH